MNQTVIGNGIDIDRSPERDHIRAPFWNVKANASASIPIFVNVIHGAMHALAGVRTHPAVVASDHVVA